MAPLAAPAPKRQVENHLNGLYPEGVRTGLKVSEPDKQGCMRVNLWLSGLGNTPFRTEAHILESGEIKYKDELPDAEAIAA